MSETMPRASAIDGASFGRIILGKYSGRHAVRQALREMDNFEPEHFPSTFALFQELVAKKGIVFEDELCALQEEAQKRQETNN